MSVVDIFYENIVTEAQVGRINCLSYYSIIFSTRIVEEDKFYVAFSDSDSVFIPTLMIKNKNLFDSLLEDYVNTALSFYSDSDFDEELLDYKVYNERDKICKEKVIMALLFANATVDDFNNPISFLNKRMEFMYNSSEVIYNLGYSHQLETHLCVEIKKDTINNETPFQFIIKAISENGEEFIFPKVKFGISEDTVYVYAIQNGKNNGGSFNKKINRRLYKIGVGFHDEQDESDESLKDVTASFLVSLNIAMSYFGNIGFKKVIVPSILIERWNSKSIVNFLKLRDKKISEKEYEEFGEKQIYLQSNLSDKLMRTFLRLMEHFNIYDVYAHPYVIDSSLHISINDSVLDCNNPLLLETYKLMQSGINMNDLNK